MMKLIGFILVTAGATAFGFSGAEELKKRHRELIDMEQSFLRLESEICCMERTLPEALRISGVGSAQEIFYAAAERIEMGVLPNEGWEYAVENAAEKLHFEAQDMEVLFRFGEGLGAFDTRGQEQNIALIKSLLKNRIELAEECVRSKGKLYRSGGVLAGLMIGIVLL